MSSCCACLLTWAILTLFFSYGFAQSNPQHAPLINYVCPPNQVIVVRNTESCDITPQSDTCRDDGEYILAVFEQADGLRVRCCKYEHPNGRLKDVCRTMVVPNQVIHHNHSTSNTTEIPAQIPTPSNISSTTKFRLLKGTQRAQMQPKNATTTVQPLTANSMIEIQPVQMRLEAIEWRNEHSQDLVKTIKKLPNVGYQVTVCHPECTENVVELTTNPNTAN